MNLKATKISLRLYLKQFPAIVSAKKAVWRQYFKIKRMLFDFSRLNIGNTFPLFKPNSAGSYKSLSALTIQTINQTIPALSAFAASVGGHKTSITDIKNFLVAHEDTEAASLIKTVFDKYGSDKANDHNYHHLYGPILKNRHDIKAMLEIGMGTNNTDVVSNMGVLGKPGASLRAFRDFLPSAQIYGADIDARILFEEDRIKTFFVDQTNPETLENLGKSIPSELDLIIDDGLHSPNANIQTLNFGLSKIKIGGWVVVEDIALEAIAVWELVTALIPRNFQSHIIRAEYSALFAVQRLS